MFAEARDVDVLDDDHLVVIFSEYGIVYYV